MKRKYIPLDDIIIHDEMHIFQPDGSFIVDEEKDGQTTQQHRDGIEYIKEILKKGQKIRPILVLEHSTGVFTRLDGFKRCVAYQELGYKNVEAFVCSEEDYRERKIFPYNGGEMRCWKGGQEKEHHSLFEGGERPNFDYDKVIFLYKSSDPAGLRIEVSETIHCHWGQFGRYRLSLGRKDFIELAKAVSAIQINGQN